MSNVKKTRLSTAYHARAVMEVYQLYKTDHDVPDKRIWRKHIKPRFGIAYRTFLRYLDLQADKIIREANAAPADRGEDDKGADAND
jgi:hypothetical protein